MAKRLGIYCLNSPSIELLPQLSVYSLTCLLTLAYAELLKSASQTRHQSLTVKDEEHLP